MKESTHHDEGEYSQAAAANPSEVHSQSSAVVANQLYSGIDVAIQPIDLHASLGAHQDAHKGGSEHPIAIEVPVIAKPDSSRPNQAMPEICKQQSCRFPIKACMN